MLICVHDVQWIKNKHCEWRHTKCTERQILGPIHSYEHTSICRYGLYKKTRVKSSFFISLFLYNNIYNDAISTFSRKFFSPGKAGVKK